MKRTPWSLLKNLDINYESVMCKEHKPTKLSYIKHHQWASRKIKMGHKQKQCNNCGFWFFKCEY